MMSHICLVSCAVNQRRCKPSVGLAIIGCVCLATEKQAPTTPVSYSVLKVRQTTILTTSDLLLKCQTKGYVKCKLSCFVD